jgi:dihydroceramidase
MVWPHSTRQWGIVALLLCSLPLAVRLGVQGPKNIDANGFEQVHGEQKEAVGTWGEATASVDWCEENYYVVPYVAEFWNSLSSVFIFLTGLYGLFVHSQYNAAQSLLEPRFIGAFVSFLVVGIGSVAFHATLWRSMQLLDELPMMWGNGVFLYIVFCMEDGKGVGSRPGLAAVIFVVTAVMTVAVTVFDKASQDVFLLCYGSGVVMLVIRTLRLQHSVEPARKQVLMETTVLFYFGGLFVWLLDRNFCAIVRPLHLHAVWHLCASTGTYSAVILWMYLRQIVHGDKPILRGSLPNSTWVDVEQGKRKD